MGLKCSIISGVFNEDINIDYAQFSLVIIV